MSEKQMREVLREVCEELDRCARKVIFPTLVGAGVAVSAGGCGENSRPAPADQRVVTGDRAVYSAPFEQGVGPMYSAPMDMRREVPPMPPYMAPPMDMMKKDTGKKVDGPPLPPYMAPDVGPPQPDYMAPDDGGIGPLYMPPWPKD